MTRVIPLTTLAIAVVMTTTAQAATVLIPERLAPSLIGLVLSNGAA